MPESNQGKLPGLPVDAFGEKTIDPTKNVLDLISKVIHRQDDLREAESKRVDQLIAEKDKQYQQRFGDTKIAVDAALIAADKAVSAALANQKEAVTKAESAAEKRFESVNEFRATLSDQQSRLMPRSEVEVIMKAQNEKIGDMQTRLDKTEGKGTGMNQSMGWILFAITIIGFLITRFN